MQLMIIENLNRVLGRLFDGNAKNDEIILIILA